MAHRALVAYRDGDRFTLYYAHRGDGLAAEIGPETPFGGDSGRPSVPTPAWLAERFDLDRVDGYAGATRVDPRPLACRIDSRAVLDAVDLTIESLVVVGPDFDTRTYAVCSLGVDGGGPVVLAGPVDDGDERALRRTLRTSKERLGRRVDAGRLDADRARRAVRRALERHAPVHSLDDASFLRPD